VVTRSTELIPAYRLSDAEICAEAHRVVHEMFRRELLVKALFWVLTPLMVRISRRVGVLVPALDRLSRLPEGSLGHAYTQYMQVRGLRQIRVGHPRAQLHDVMHVLTGYDTDFSGEGELQGFLLGVKPPWRNWLVINNLGGITYYLARGRRPRRFWRAVRRGWRSRIDPDSFPIQTLWALPLADVRRRYRILEAPADREARRAPLG
jgi:ubiquinone biosynthesis protein COQ4